MVERVADDRIAPGLVHVPIGKRDVEVLVNGQIVEQMVVLENETDLLVPKRGAFLWLQGVNRDVVEEIFAAPGVIVHSEDVEQRRFARAGRPHDGNEVAFVHLQVDVAQDVKEFALRERIKAFEVFECDH